MIAIFNNEAEAIAYSEKIHKYLLAVRPNYNATKWAEPTEGVDGKWSVKAPPEYDNNRWGIPLDVTAELSTAEGKTKPLPEIGQKCDEGQYYLYKGDILKCRQTHNRTIYEPKDTPALFSFFRDNSAQLEWITGEWVEVGWIRIYNGLKYEVIQAHQTQSDWTPDKTPTLWKLVEEPSAEIPVWKQPTGAHDAYKKGDVVWFPTLNSTKYESLIDANVWSPTVYPAGWKKI